MILLGRQLVNCRICKGSIFISIINFGQISLTGIFIEDGKKVPTASLELVRCENCGLTQLNNSYDVNLLYGEGYGYESNLNSSMREHLINKAQLLEYKYLKGKEDCIIVDIASNDGTLLSGYMNLNLQYVGIDPLANTLNDFYPKNAIKISEFFSEKIYSEKISKRAALVTSLSVIYDLEDPLKFAKDVWTILDENGIWHFEQSYLPTMVATNGFDTICHEHLLYLTLKDIKTILGSAGFQILDASLNDINGGSIAITAIKSLTKQIADPFVTFLTEKEVSDGFSDSSALELFSKRIAKYKVELSKLLQDYKFEGYEIVGLGASTKGNVLLQFCGIDANLVTRIGDINPKKYGKRTPGSNIEIVPEDEIFNKAHNKMVAMVLPWHFRIGITKKSHKFLGMGARMLFPLPNIEIISN